MPLLRGSTLCRLVTFITHLMYIYDIYIYNVDDNIALTLLYYIILLLSSNSHLRLSSERHVIRCTRYARTFYQITLCALYIRMHAATRWNHKFRTHATIASTVYRIADAIVFCSYRNHSDVKR